MKSILSAIAVAVVAICSTAPVSSFSPPLSLIHKARIGTSLCMSDALPNNVQPLDGSEASIANAATFMVDSFWLQSPQQLVQGASSDTISEAAKASLINIQADDLMDKYGERMTRRKLDALILAATDGDEILGMVTIEVRLLDITDDILSGDVSEFKVTQAVASLGPKQRREFKDASVLDIANQLLPPGISAVCSLSNLCVSPAARRKGIAAKLCSEAERVAKEELGFEEMFLRVESKNAAAKTLYEKKLGYESVFDVFQATALRVGGDSGSFVEIESDIVVLMKKI